MLIKIYRIHAYSVTTDNGIETMTPVYKANVSCEAEAKTIVRAYKERGFVANYRQILRVK